MGKKEKENETLKVHFESEIANLNSKLAAERADWNQVFEEQQSTHKKVRDELLERINQAHSLIIDREKEIKILQEESEEKLNEIVKRTEEEKNGMLEDLKSKEEQLRAFKIELVLKDVQFKQDIERKDFEIGTLLEQMENEIRAREHKFNKEKEEWFKSLRDREDESKSLKMRMTIKDIVDS